MFHNESSPNEKPDDSYNDTYHLPSDVERKEEGTYYLRPVEAHSLLVKLAGELSEGDKKALRAIMDSDNHPDESFDFHIAEKTGYTLDGGYHEDDDE